LLLLAGLIPLLAGCASPYRSDQGALFGGITGAGLGAVVGSAVGDPLAGAAIGAGAGAVTGAVVGDQLDQIEARNRAEIEARLGRPVAPGAVRLDEVVAMTKAGVSDDVIINHIRVHGSAQIPQTNDLIYLQQNQVSQRVIAALQQPPPAVSAVPAPPPGVVVQPCCVDPYPWGPGWYPPPPPPGWYGRRWHGPRPAPGISVGVGISR
jgi:hypothetical protein